jgi:RHS repeat-associated protein
VRNTYDAKSRLQTVSYPGSVNFVAKYAYDNLGHVLEVQNHSGGPSAVSSFWRASEKNAQAQLKKEKFGNGITTSVDYHPLFGVSSINVKKGIHSLLELLYTYDENGNLQKHLDRTIETAILQEEFTYDKLNRLEKMDNYVIDATDLVNPKVFQYAKEYGYTDSGNILGISDVGNFGYGSGNGFGLGDAGPHAITSNGVGDTYTYDDNGNTIASGNVASGNVTDIEWYAFNKAKSTVNQAQGTEVQFQYNSYNDKIHQVFHDQNSHSTTTYIGEWYEKVEHENGLVEHKHYVSAGGAPIAIFVKESTGNEDVLYLHRSNLTSVAMITDKSGNILEQLSYHPFGLRRPPDWSQSGSVSSITDHGYTDHEHIANDAVGIIDTGGRLYNPQTGRFLSNDSYFEFPAYSQATNPYSYTVNNPVSYYDPSGNQTKPPPPWYERMWKSFVKWEHDFNHPTAKPKPWERIFNLGAENFVRQYHPVIVILENGIIVVSGENLNGNAADRVKASIKLLKEVSRYRNVKSAMDAANVVIKQAEKKLTKEAVEQLKKDLKKAVEELERMERERFIDSEPDTIKEPSDREITSAPKFSTPGSTAPATEFPTLGSTAEGIAFLAKAIGFSALSSLFPSSGATATASTPATTVPAESLNPVKILACVFTGGCGG